MKNAIIVIIFCIVLAACGKDGNVTPNDEVKITTHNIAKTKSYNIPKGIFRGVLWPEPGKFDFEVWVIRNGKELFYNVPAPAEIFNWEKQITDSWQIQAIDGSNNMLKFIASSKDKSIVVEFELPKKQRQYSFSVLESKIGEKSILFMDISQDISDKGLFGYMVIKS